MKFNPARVFFAVLLAVAGANAQVAYFPDNVPSTGAVNLIPYRNSSYGTTGYTVYVVYPAATLAAAGVAPGSVLTDLAVAPSNASGASGTINVPVTQIYFGHLALNPPVAGQWLNNVAGAVTLWDTSSDGPLIFNWVADTWASIPIACHGGGFVWDGVTDVIFYQTLAGTSFPGGGWTGGFSVHTGAAYVRHGLNGYQPAVGTAPSTTGTLGFKIRLTFASAGTCFGLTGGTSGGAAGDLILNVVNLPAGTTEGFTLVTASAIGAPNTGPLFGIWPDNQTWQFIGTPAGAGNPLHFTAATPGVFPLAPFSVPPGTLSFLGGQTWDAVLVALAPGLTYLGHTNVLRLPW